MCVLSDLRDALRARVAEQAGATLAELRAWIVREYGRVGRSRDGVGRVGPARADAEKSACARPNRTTPVYDNLSSYKVAGVHEAVAAPGAALLYLPPYCPNLNAIELMFSKLKRLLRSAAAWTVDALWNAVRYLLAHFKAHEYARYIGHCGCAHSRR